MIQLQLGYAHRDDLTLRVEGRHLKFYSDPNRPVRTIELRLKQARLQEED